MQQLERGYIFNDKPPDTAILDSYIDIALKYDWDKLGGKDFIESIVFSDEAMEQSRFTYLARWRYRLTGSFNRIIVGEMLDDMDLEIAVAATKDGFALKRLQGQARLPYADTGNRDGDLIDGTNFTVLKLRREKKRKNNG